VKARKSRNKDKNIRDASQLFNFARDSYLERTSRPFYALIFLLPFIIFYELGTIFINTDLLNQSQVRVVAFVWLQRFLGYLGFGDKFAWAAPALAVVIILVALQIVSRKQWYFGYKDVLPMSVECILLAVPLVVLSLFLNGYIQPKNDIKQLDGSRLQVQTQLIQCSSEMEAEPSPAVEDSRQSPGRQELLAAVVTSIGAGIYEELVFRLILICLLMILFQDGFRLDRKNAIIFSVLVSAVMFSAHHHIDFFSGQMTEPFNMTAFGFRTLAGIYFAVVFAVRGFAITAGTHAFYDIIVVFLNTYFLNQ